MSDKAKKHLFKHNEFHAGSGRISNEQKNFIRENMYEMSVEQIAKAINKNPDTVKKFIDEEGDGDVPKEIINARKAYIRLQKSPTWKQILKQFDDNELDVFKNDFESIMVQFRGDVMYTEQLQIIDICKLEIIHNRMLAKIYNNEKLIKQAEETLAIMKNRNDDIKDISAQQALISGLLSLSGTLHKDIKDIIDRKQKILIDMKGTRDQRIKRIEGSKSTLADFLTKIMEDPDKRKAVGLELERRRIAKEIEAARLTDYHKYCDGMVEQPILSHETLKEDNIEI